MNEEKGMKTTRSRERKIKKIETKKSRNEKERKKRLKSNEYKIYLFVGD